MEGTIDPHRPLSVGGWAGRFSEVAREVGLDLLPPAAFGFHFSDNGTVSSHLLKRIAAGQEAVAFLDETTRQVYKIYNVRSSTMGGMGWGGEASANLFDWGADAAATAAAQQTSATLSTASASGYRMGLKLAATKHHRKWEVDTRSGNLFDMIEKVIALDGAGALPTEIIGMLDTGDHLVVKKAVASHAHSKMPAASRPTAHLICRRHRIADRPTPRFSPRCRRRSTTTGTPPAASLTDSVAAGISGARPGL